jgi:signal peptide peptidase SppA
MEPDTDLVLEFGDTARCFVNHLGIWCIEPLWFNQAVLAVKEGLWCPGAFDKHEFDETPVAIDTGRKAYDVLNRVARIPLIGPMMKGDSKFGGVSTVRARRLLQTAARDPDVDSILLHIDSPGGHVAGTQALADDVYRIDRTVKPVVTHYDDLGASAAVWVGSQARHVSVNRGGEVGSIGTVAVLEDTSKRMDRLGVTVHVISTGPYKGTGVEGTPLSTEGLAYIRERVESLNHHFVEALTRGRPLSLEQLHTLREGKVYGASDAQRLGLVDRITSLEEALETAPRGAGIAGGRAAVAADELRAQRLRQRLASQGDTSCQEK